MKTLFDIRFFNGNRFIACAENIMADSAEKAALAAIRAIASRRDYLRKSADDRTLLYDLHEHLRRPKLYPRPDGLRVFVARVDLGKQVI